MAPRLSRATQRTLSSTRKISARWRRAIRTGLTGLEAQVLTLYLEGLSYREIAEEVHRSTKAVDNAVQRVRRKVAQYLSQGEPSKS
ncbi:MAG: sigma factor-like helix-turn-helix DNA-binding protein [Evtepia sp.]